MQNSLSQRTRRVLLLSGPRGEDPELLRFLNAHSVVRIVQSVEEALHALRGQHYDLIVSESDNLPALADAGLRLANELGGHSGAEAVALLGPPNDLVWSNPAFGQLPVDVQDDVRHAAAAALAAQPPPAGEARHQTLNRADRFFDLTLTAVLDAQDQPARVVAVVRDVTDLSRLQGKLNAIDAAGGELVALDAEAMSELDVPARLQLLETTIIRYCRELLHYDHFAVRLVDPATHRLDTVLAGGFSEEAKSLELKVGTAGGGISGYVAATGKSYVCGDVQSDPLYRPGLENARSSVTVPLKMHDQVIGVFNIESEKPEAFSEQDCQFAEIFGRYIALALHILKLLVVERRSTADSLGEDVAAELDAPLNEIIAEVTTLAASLRGNEQALEHLRAIMTHVGNARETIRAVVEPAGVSGLVPAHAAADPLLEGQRILIAEDEDIIRETLTEVLTAAGAITVPVRDGAEAINALEQQRYDLVLSDIKMPNKTGYQVFARVKELSPTCPVILLTGFGYDPNHSIVRASKEGLAGVLFKPFKVEQLLDQVREALAARRSA